MDADPSDGDLTKWRRRLPHWEMAGATYFITWRCAPGVLLSPGDRDLVSQSLRHWDGERYLLFAATVMPDHVHALLKPLLHRGRGSSLTAIVHGLKSYSAHGISGRRGTEGPVWQDERFDRIVRHEAAFLEKWNYIRNNAVARGLVARAEEYSWLVEARREP